jgi:hypothetical protein
MTDTPAPRRKPILRKEVVPTKTWGDVVVRQFTGTVRMGISAVFTPSDNPALASESEQETRARQRVEYDRMINAVLENAVTAPGSDDPLYSADEWDAWQVQTGNSDEETKLIGDDLMAVTQKALGMNGYRLLPQGEESIGEDVAKNA